MSDHDQFRSPQIGDTVRPVRPTQIDTPMFPAGSALSVRLDTQESVEFARTLVAGRTWCVEPKGGDE